MLSSSFTPGLPSKIATNSSLDSVETFTPFTAKKQSPDSVNVHEHERVCARAYVYMHVCIFVQVGLRAHNYSPTPRPLNSAGPPGSTPMTSSLHPLEQPLGCLNRIPTDPSLPRVIVTAVYADDGRGSGCSFEAGGGDCSFFAGAGINDAALCARSSMMLRMAWFVTTVFSCNLVLRKSVTDDNDETLYTLFVLVLTIVTASELIANALYLLSLFGLGSRFFEFLQHKCPT